MKKTISIALFLILPFLVKAQVSFNTVIPAESIVVGSAFQVQYVIEGAETIDNFKPSGFENFRIVTGPNIYTGTTNSIQGAKIVRNIIFTLEAIRPGKFMIPGASVLLDNKKYRSSNAFVQVISAKEATRLLSLETGNTVSNYFLRPGEDPYKKIKENLFIKVQVDKKSCYTGEPVLATFKLYSSLQSKSDIVKNPGFYGFSVFDMISLSDKEVTAEKVNGKLFDVHTIRKVQLFPLRSGTFTIDPMEVRNKVEFSRSAVAKKTEQEIAEGMLGNEDEPEKTDAVYFESDISTESVAINVKPLPVNNKPVDFNGATGKFSVTAALLKDELAKNEEGMFEVTIKGTGNFIQLTAPVVNWPEGVDAFEPTIKDNFDKSLTPLTGYRTFRFPFICTNKGDVEIPSVQFTYFDIDSNRYKSISTSPVKFAVTEEQKTNPVTEKKKTSITDINKNSSRVAAGIVIGLVLIVLIYWIRRKKEAIPEERSTPFARPEADEVLKLASESVNDTDSNFYKNLHQSLWGYLAEAFNLEGGIVNKIQMLEAAKQKEIPEVIINKLEFILSECDTGQFTNATPGADRQELLQSAKEVIISIEEYLL